ncbi:hypothetical protein [Thiothrix fructosivorans]|nr:hypothetical protein [Thiothrix fructosivorans]QTX09721.1 hypothetical protein J1836_014000 [Thiothrix fructosivorans]
MTLFSSALIAGALFTSSVAMAAPHAQHQRLDVNIAQLDMRIDAGVKSGKLTQSEERQVRKELRTLGTSVKAALKDHKVTKRERANVADQEVALNKLITKLSNNKVVVKKDERHDGKRDQRDQHQPAPVKSDKMQHGQFDQGRGHDKAPPMPYAQHAK